MVKDILKQIKLVEANIKKIIGWEELEIDHIKQTQNYKKELKEYNEKVSEISKKIRIWKEKSPQSKEISVLEKKREKYRTKVKTLEKVVNKSLDIMKKEYEDLEKVTKQLNTYIKKKNLKSKGVDMQYITPLIKKIKKFTKQIEHEIKTLEKKIKTDIKKDDLKETHIIIDKLKELLDNEFFLAKEELTNAIEATKEIKHEEEKIAKNKEKTQNFTFFISHKAEKKFKDNFLTQFVNSFNNTLNHAINLIRLRRDYNDKVVQKVQNEENILERRWKTGERVAFAIDLDNKEMHIYEIFLDHGTKYEKFSNQVAQNRYKPPKTHEIDVKLIA